MKKATIAFIFCLAAIKADCQKVFEAGIKPTECAFLNFETHIGIGTATTRYGLLLSYRPSTQESGAAIPQFWNGAGGDYDRRFANKLYTSYTLGLYGKRYFGTSDLFLQADAFYRNWHFDKKHAEYDNVERALSSYNGTRTENVNVYCMKLLFGRTFYAKVTNSSRLYMDLYAGVGARYQQETYETFDGTVGSTYYSYKKDEHHYFWPTPQCGIMIGIVHGKPIATTTPPNQ